MIQISRFEKIFGIILIFLTVSSLGLLYYFGFISLNSNIVVTNKYPDITFEFPINPIFTNDGSEDLFVLEHQGKVKVVTDPSEEPIVALDLAARDNFFWDWEGGLIGLTLDPNFATNRFVYVFFTEADERVPGVDCDDKMEKCATSILARYIYDPDTHKLLEETELRIIELPQFVPWHRAGQMNFRESDGMFYVNIGDSLRGGSELNNIYGKILRLDVSQSNATHPYTIPTDNPFYGNSEGYREEIYAYGLRNPWRASFDHETDTFWVADVGKDKFEELNKVEEGKNYGWNLTEGYECTPHLPDCNPSDYELPIFAYPHETTANLDDPYGVAIIGGYIYRGSKFPELKGKYVFGDYGGSIWALTFNDDYTEVKKSEFIVRMPVLLSSIGVDLDGELMFAGHAGGNIYEFSRISEAASDMALGIILYLLGMGFLTGGSFYLQAKRAGVTLKPLEMKKYTVWRFFIFNALAGFGYVLYHSIILTLYSTEVPQ